MWTTSNFGPGRPVSPTVTTVFAGCMEGSMVAPTESVKVEVGILGSSVWLLQRLHFRPFGEDKEQCIRDIAATRLICPIRKAWKARVSTTSTFKVDRCISSDAHSLSQRTQFAS